jgi:hypothetical protein
MDKRELSERRHALSEEERKECEVIHEKYKAARKQIVTDCIAAGYHKLNPCNGISADYNLAGQWPHRCFTCGYIKYL